MENYVKRRTQQFGDIRGSLAWCKYCKQGCYLQYFKPICSNTCDHLTIGGSARVRELWYLNLPRLALCSNWSLDTMHATEFRSKFWVKAVGHADIYPELHNASDLESFGRNLSLSLSATFIPHTFSGCVLFGDQPDWPTAWWLSDKLCLL